MDEDQKKKIQIMKGIFNKIFDEYPPDDQDNLLKIAEIISSMQVFFLDICVHEESHKSFMDEIYKKVMDSLASLKAAKMVVGAYLGQQERNGEV